jgi:hypothetical protein
MDYHNDAESEVQFSEGEGSIDSSTGHKRKHGEVGGKREELKWRPALDKILLQDCLEKEVWTATRNTRIQMFQAVAESLKPFDPERFKLATQRNCQRRFYLLYETYLGESFAKLNQSGTDEEYEEREVLLQNIKDCTTAFKDELVATASQKNAMEKQLQEHGKIIREAAIRGAVKQTAVPNEQHVSMEANLGKLVTVLTDMASAAKPPPPPPMPVTMSFHDAGIANVWHYLMFAGIPQKWHAEYVQLLENYGFDTVPSIWLANGQQLAQAGIKMGHVNLLLDAKSKLKNSF